ncbi:M3 family metallopeptidase [Pikeienuella sp. HZG-20]|uniref:M3 family metallopeptidase n=1 Tax=Paludibacillus litoralis TaxID=3133267 RepID=UPI0030ED73DC
MNNPLLGAWSTPFEIPPFDAIRPEHFRPAFEVALAEDRADIDAIANDPAPPTFANTIAALERSGRTLTRVASVFFNLVGVAGDEAMQETERWVAPVLSRHRAETVMNEKLFARIEALMARRADLGLDPEADRVLELTSAGFIRAGAQLRGPARARMTEIMSRLAVLGAQFSQNVLKDENDWTLRLDGADALAGLPDFLIDAAAAAAKARGIDGHVITLSRSLISPFLQFSANRALREEAWRAWVGRGETNPGTDNRAVAAEILALRAERARLLGFRNFAAFKLDNQMAKTPDRVRDLLMSVWAPARARAEAEREALAALAASEGANIEIQPWDWRYYAEKQRRAEHDLDEAELKPYLPLDAVISAAFDCARRLFGLEFAELRDAPRPHPDARVWKVTREGAHVAVFIGDYFARRSKRSGAWMSAYRAQQNLDGRVRPIVSNAMNFARGDDATLLTFDDARTLFHEFGHALHGMLSDVTYPSIAGTSVARDFVELPSQLFEHWLSEKSVLKRFAKHYRTGAPMPAELIDRVLAAQNFGQGFASVEYVASALVDLEMHLVEDDEARDPLAFEAEVLERLAMPAAITMRHRTPHFTHVFAGDGYSAGYYSYMWSEVLDADAFAAFEEAGDPFDPEAADRLARTIYAAGGRQDPESAYLAFRGRLPTVDALLRRRGLDEA